MLAVGGKDGGGGEECVGGGTCSVEDRGVWVTGTEGEAGENTRGG